MASDTDEVRPFFVNGAWTHGSGSTFESIDPTDGSIAAVVAEATAPDVDSAVQAARLALERPSWRDLKAHHLAHQTFTDADALDRAIHVAVTSLNSERNVNPLVKQRISA